jgi:Ca-activated chloride channel homolog
MLRPIGLIGLFLCQTLACAPAFAEPPVKLDVHLAQPVMKSGETQTNYLRVALGGCKPEPTRARTPVNVAFVIDRSGSMNGYRIAQAREAASLAVSRLQPTDVASVVIFDDRAEVLLPAQHVTDPALFLDRIRQIGVRGQTAIYAGVGEGAEQVRIFKDPSRLNRIVLLSDGQANVGPRRAEEFAVLGRSLLAEGISVSTIGLGLGYNEDLMLQLARAGDGNHAFAREPTDLINIFNREFDDVLGSCAQTVSIDIELKPGIKAVKALSRDAAIDGQHAVFKLNQVYAATEHYVLLQIELDKALAGAGETDLGSVKVAYTASASGNAQTLDGTIRARLGASQEEVDKSVDPRVAESVIEQVTRERANQAVALRDQGKWDEAQKLFQTNASELNSVMSSIPVLGSSPRMTELHKQYQALGATAAPPAPAQMSLERKLLRQLDATSAGAAVRY